MNEIHTVEPAYHPKHKLGFLIDWLLTLKCNYDCTYCDISPKGHDNSKPHPSTEKCITMLKQMYEYTDIMMQLKKPQFKDAILNVYGGEAIYHPNITEILIRSTEEFKPYQNRWRLQRRLTTNASALQPKWKTICEHIEGFTFSYHAESPPKHKPLFKKNIEHVLKIGKAYDIVIMMYPHDDHWQDCINFLKYCQSNNLNVRPKLLDGGWLYEQKHLDELQKYIPNDPAFKTVSNKVRIDKQTRGCCGGRPLCTNRNLKDIKGTVPRKQGFEGWHCSAHQFFLHGDCVNGLYYTNKDCRMKLDGTRGPISTIDTMPEYIESISQKINSNSMPMLLCKQEICTCGTCAPKSKHPENLQKILKVYNLN